MERPLSLVVQFKRLIFPSLKIQQWMKRAVFHGTATCACNFTAIPCFLTLILYVTEQWFGFQHKGLQFKSFLSCLSHFSNSRKQLGGGVDFQTKERILFLFALCMTSFPRKYMWPSSGIYTKECGFEALGTPYSWSVTCVCTKEYVVLKLWVHHRALRGTLRTQRQCPTPVRGRCLPH